MPHAEQTPAVPVIRGALFADARLIALMQMLQVLVRTEATTASLRSARGVQGQATKGQRKVKLPPLEREAAAKPMDADALFDEVDTDRSGTISASELLQYLLKQPGGQPSKVQMLLSSITTDANGEISRSEWQKAWASGSLSLLDPAWAASHAEPQRVSAFAMRVLLAVIRLAAARSGVDDSKSASVANEKAAKGEKSSKVTRMARGYIQTLRSSSRSDETEAALTDLSRLAAGSGPTVAAALSNEEGGLEALVEQGAHGTLNAKEMAVALLRRVADLSHEERTAIAAAGGLATIVKMLSSSTSTARMRVEACAALANLARDHAANQAAIAKAGAVPHLVRVLESKLEGEALAAASALCAVSASQDAATMKIVCKEDTLVPLAKWALPVMLAMTAATESTTNEEALDLLLSTLRLKEAPAEPPARPNAATAGADAKALRTVAQAIGTAEVDAQECLPSGLLSGIVELSTTSTKVAEHAALTALIVAYEASPQEMVDSGALGMCVDLLLDGASRELILTESGAALRHLAHTSTGRASLISACVPQLAAGLAASVALAQEQTTDVLASLAATDEGRHAICAAEGAPEELVRLADGKSTASKLASDTAVAILRTIAMQPALRSALIRAGAVQPLVNRLRSGTTEDLVVTSALRALNTLPSGQLDTANAGGVAPLVSLLRYGRPQMQQDAREILHGLSANIGTREKVVADTDVVAACVAAFSLNSPRSPRPGRSLGSPRGSSSRALGSPLKGRSLGSPRGSSSRALGSPLKGRSLGSPTRGSSKRLRLDWGSEEGSAQLQLARILADVAAAGRAKDVVEAGGVAALIEVLQQNTGDTCAEALRALRTLVDDRASHAPLAASGLARLVELSTKSNDETIREGATATLVKLGCGGDQSAVEAMASSEGLIELLVRQLGGGADEQHSATMVLVELSAHASALASLVKLGGVAPLVSVAEQHESAEARRAAAMVLARLAAPPHVESLLQATRLLCTSLTYFPHGALAFATALSHLVFLPKGFADILHHGVAPLAGLLSSKLTDVQGPVLTTLAKLVSQAEGQAAVGAEVEIEQLVRIAGNYETSPSTQTHSIGILCELTRQDALHTKLLRYGVVRTLLSAMQQSGSMQQAAVAALRRLTCGISSPQGELEIKSAGGVPAIIDLLFTQAVEIQPDAMAIVRALTECDATRNAVAAVPDAIAACLSVLDCTNASEAAMVDATGCLACLAYTGMSAGTIAPHICSVRAHGLV